MRRCRRRDRPALDRAARGAGRRSAAASRARAGRAAARRRSRRLRARRLLLDDQPPDARCGIDGQWIDGRAPADGRGDRRSTAAAPSCRKLRDVRAGDAVVCGVDGIRVMPEFQERDRHGFAFMTNEISSERRVEVGVARIAAMMRDDQGRPAAASPSSPARSSSTPAAAPYFCELIRARLRRRAARRQRARRARRRAGAVRHVARRRPREPARRSKAATAITCARSTRSAAPAACARRSSRAC